MQSSHAGPSASHHWAVGAAPRLQHSAKQSGSTAREVQLIITFPTVKLCYKAQMRHVQAPCIFLPSDSALIVPFPEGPRSSLEADYFQSHCLLDIIGI